jgi:hypothetical protein
MTIEELLIKLNREGYRFEYDPTMPDLRLISKKIDIVIYYDQAAIFADRILHFDKPSKCPVKLYAPTDDNQFAYLISRLNWLRTTEGYHFSEDNRWMPIEQYPPNIDW